MKASYQWLRALLPGLLATPSEVAARLTSGGLEVEGTTEYGVAPEVVIAEVRALEPHPHRPKLRLVTVDRGGGVLQRIVCGAPNVPEPGGLVALAPVGARVGAVTLAARDIGGVPSEGMLCSEAELGLVGAVKKEDDHGILILPKGTGAPGVPLASAVPATHDWIFEINVTANRPDALGHIGIARELAALYGLPFGASTPDSPARVAPGTIARAVTVVNEDTERCPHYGASMVVDVRVGPSPDWLRYRLESLGIRSISNVVDVTNLVLLEYGHPMHAFDLDGVRGGRIEVRRARAGEVLKTLDGLERKLDPDDLVIADGEGAVALAGVMGGASSEITPQTSRVLLECAYFWPRGVRRSSRRHGLHTESSHRFERGVDYADVPDVLAHAASLLTQLAGGAAVPGSILAGVPFPVPPPITLRAARMNALLGVEVPFGEALEVLARLGCTVEGTQETGGAPMLAEAAIAKVGAVEIVPPTHRPDLTREVDLIEEVMRVRGLHRIPTVLPAIKPQAPRPRGAPVTEVRRAAIELGLSEALTYGFVSPRELEAMGAPPAAVVLKNPLTEERSVMRTSLLPGLCEVVRRARRHGVDDVRVFAVGARFLAGGNADGLPDEAPSFAAVIAGSRRAVLSRPVPVDVYDAKGLATEIVARVTHGDPTVEHQPAARRAPHLHPRAAADVLLEGRVVGSFGILHPDVVDRLDLGGPAVVVELDLRALAAFGLRPPRYRPIPVLPAATRDIALVVHEDVTAGAVGDAIREAASDLCESVELFDLFQGAGIPAEHRSLAYHVVYRDPKAATAPETARTLTDEEVDRRHQAVVDTVKKRFGAVLRA